MVITQNIVSIIISGKDGLSGSNVPIEFSLVKEAATVLYVMIKSVSDIYSEVVLIVFNSL